MKDEEIPTVQIGLNRAIRVYGCLREKGKRTTEDATSWEAASHRLGRRGRAAATLSTKTGLGRDVQGLDLFGSMLCTGLSVGGWQQKKKKKKKGRQGKAPKTTRLVDWPGAQSRIPYAVLRGF